MNSTTVKDSIELRKHSQIKLCLFCSKPLKGRSDKKFCDEQCKNQYHNLAVEDGEKTYKRVLKILRKNRQVLKELLGEQSSVVLTKEKLVARGYDPDFLTHFKEVGAAKRRYYFTFDYGYREEGDENVKVVKAFKW